MRTPKYFNVRSALGIFSPDQIKFLLDITEKVQGIEEGATADQTSSEIQVAYDAVVSIVTQAEAEAGVATTSRRWTAERVRQSADAAIAAANDETLHWIKM